MGFKSENEIENFSFDDCVISKRYKNNTDISYEVEALIVGVKNSQNTNFTESYAGTAFIRFINGMELLGVKDGMKEYDADDNLISEVPDINLDSLSFENLLKNLDGMYLEGIEKIAGPENDYVIFIEKKSDDEYDTVSSDSYQIKIRCDKIIVEWERYMNRVQR